MESLLKVTQRDREKLNKLPEEFSNIINLVGPYPLLRDTELYKKIGKDNRGNKVT